MMDYYQLPLKLGEVIRQEEHPKCVLSDSVAALLHLISITHFGECKYDESFGCEIWEHDFENISNTQLYKEQLRKLIQETLERYEPRLAVIRVDIQIDQVDYNAGRRRTKSRISLDVKGTLTKTNETFAFAEQFFIGPLSYTL